MKWLKFTITTTTQAEDFLSAMLDEIGIEGIETENNTPLSEHEKSSMFIDFPPELPEDDGVSHISFYLEPGEDVETILDQVRTGIEEQRRFVDVGEGSIRCGETQDEDWINNWKKFFKSFSIDDILIRPTWEEEKAEDKDKIIIEIDPGISFGTGKHETTRLCIRQLRRYVKPGMEVLDVGFGSGILSVVSLKLGAAHLTGTDIDDVCAASARKNLKVNKIAGEMCDFYTGNLIDDSKLREKVGADKYDIVVANILADVIIPMAPVISDRLKAGGIFIASGIIDFKENDVRKAVEKAGMQPLETNRLGEWVCITAKK